jgi:hypothetical protein
MRDTVGRSNALSSIAARLDRIERSLALLIEALRPENPPKPERRVGSGKSNRPARL